MAGFVLIPERPIVINGTNGVKRLDRIEFREPTGADLFDFGEPFVVERTIQNSAGQPDRTALTLRVTRNMTTCKAYLSRLSDLAGLELSQLSARDMMKAIDWLCDVAFGDGGEKQLPPSQPPSGS